MKAAKDIVVQPISQKIYTKEEEMIEIDVVDVKKPILIDDNDNKCNNNDSGIEEWHWWEKQTLIEEINRT